jgi:hypothetical protein
MEQKVSEAKDLNGLSGTIKFCCIVDLLLLFVWFFYKILGSSFIGFAIPGILIALLFTFLISCVVSLVYATRIKEFSWKALLPLSVNISTVSIIILLINIMSR